MRLSILTCLLIGVAIPACADQWAKFLPEGIDPNSVQCNVSVVVENHAGEKVSPEFWHADASGKWRDGQHWTATAGKFEANKKGRHQAEKVCSQLADEAERRMGRK